MIGNWVQNIAEPPRQLLNLIVLRKLLFAFTLFHFVQVYPFIELLYNPKFSIIYQRELSAISLSSMVNILAIPRFSNLHYWLFAFQIVFSIIGLFSYLPRVSTIIVWYCTINLQNRVYPSTTGGDLLLNLLLFYLIFASDTQNKTRNIKTTIQNILNHFSLLFCKTQVILVYLISSIYKLLSHLWLDGSALKHTLCVKEYSMPFIINNIDSFTFPLMVLTWLTLAYQIVFPFLVYVKKARIFYLLSGITMHLGIGLIMGLFDFSLIMIFSYILFIPLKNLQTISKKISSLFPFIKKEKVFLRF